MNEADYRFGFNGKEGDDEVKGDDNQQDYGMRIYDPKAGRFSTASTISGLATHSEALVGEDANKEINHSQSIT